MTRKSGTTLPKPMRSRPLFVGHAEHQRPIMFASGAEKLVALTHELSADAYSTVLLVDATVQALYPALIKRLKNRVGRRLTILTIPSGERYKSGTHLLKLLGAVLDLGIERSSMIIAIGGGVTTDLAGCVSSLLLRGLRWIAIPTTFLGMVDAAIGGKTGVNTRQGKNLIGTFWAPEAVLIEPDFIRTQPLAEFADSEAEAVKYFALRGKPALSKLKMLLKQFPLHDPQLAESIIRQCARIKAQIVMADERENGQRVFLNFGHTIGHTLEFCGGYRHISHGRAVAAGMVGALYLSGLSQKNSLPATMAVADLENYCRLLAAGKPVRIDCEAALDSLIYDKKRRDGKLMFVLLQDIGRPYLQQAPDKRTLRKAVKLAIEALNGQEKLP